MPKRFPSAIGPLAGALAGALIGLVDGTRAGWLVGADARALAASAVLAASADALLGALAGALVEMGARLTAWGWRPHVRGRRGRLGIATRIAAFILVGAGAAAGTRVAVVGMALRNNRFLAAGLAGLAALALALGGAMLAPALARLATAFLTAAQRGARAVRGVSSAAGTAPAATAAAIATPGSASAPSATALVAVPAVLALIGGAIFLLLWKSRSPLHGHLLQARIARTAAVAAVGPWLVARAVTLRPRLRWPVAAGIALLLFGAPATAAVLWSWSDNLRFAPWVDIGVGAAIALLALLLALLRPLTARLPTRAPRRFLLAGAAAALAAGVLLPVSASESARKAGAARTGLVAPLLALGREVLDFDHDGYARLLGGGDCDDGDREIHPGAIDLPGDGIDQDCDGRDATVAALEPATFAPVPDSVPRDLNFVFLTIDTLRADHLGCYGYKRPTSPALDALAAQGTLFENGWAHAPSTRYSMPAIATGRWPSTIDWDESIWWPRMRNMRTMAEALHDAGYFTAGLFSFSYFALSDRRGFERGMDYYNADRAALHVAVNGPMESHGTSSREMADDAIAFLDAHRAQKFFLWLHFYDPHLSYEPHPEVTPSFGSSRPDLYDGEIRFTDIHVGRVLAHLRALGIDNRTAIVVTGDHGEGLGEHGITEHGFDLYAAQTKVPFIIRVPGLPAQRLTQPAGHIDLAPTLVNLARGKPEPSFLGRSLVPLLVGGAAAAAVPEGQKRDAVFQEVSSERGKKRALVTATHHLMWNWIPNNTTECYDHRRDPEETHDLWGRLSTDAECVRLKHDLETMVSTLALPPGYADKMTRGIIPADAPDPRPPIALDADIGEQIRVIGADITPASVARGGEVTVTIYFQSKKRLADRWRLFFHLDGPGGFRNLDHVPVDGLMPVDRWHPGQRIRDVQHVFIPVTTPPGVYTFSVGAFRSADRLKVTPARLTDGRDRLRVGTFVVR
jgi:choline-sulfatase